MKQPSRAVFWVIIVILVVAAIGLLLYAQNKNTSSSTVVVTGNQPGNTGSGQTGTTTNSSGFDRTISDGIITISYPSATYGLAATTSQILAKAYIPPCLGNFDYCLYYTGKAYAGSNFESAGVRIQSRPDLTTQQTCLKTQPTGYDGLVPTVASSSNYAISSFSPIGDAGAGHYASGAIYRLAYAGQCYEFQTQLGQTQYANYPSGSINLFTAAGQTQVQSQMKDILNSIKLPSGATVSFPG